MHFITGFLNRLYTYIYLFIVKIVNDKKFKFSIQGPSIGLASRFIIRDKGHIGIGKKIGVRRRCEFSVSENGIIEIGDNCFFNNGCILTAHKQIVIGQGTRFGPNVMVYDHDYDFKDITSFIEGKHIVESIIIGENCWIGAGAIILRGTIIGDNCVIGAGSVIKGTYGNNQLIIQKKEESIRELRN